MTTFPALNHSIRSSAETLDVSDSPSALSDWSQSDTSFEIYDLASFPSDSESSLEKVSSLTSNAPERPSTYPRNITRNCSFKYAIIAESARLRDARLRRAGNHLLRYSLNYGLKLLWRRGRRHQSYLVAPSEPSSAENFVFRFLDLPSELILDILEICETNTLYCLTATSRLVCNVVFPIFIRSAGLDLPDLNQSASKYVSQKSLQGMVDIEYPEQALALCVWRRHQSFRCVAVLNLVLEMPTDQLAVLVNRSLAFFGSPSPLDTPFAKMINIYISSSHGNIVAEAARLIFGLRISKCSRLSITGFTRAGDYSSVVSDSVLPVLERTETGYESLEVFHVCGTFPFQSHMLSFTMSDLLNRRLRDLELSMSGFCVARWATFLKSASFPMLENINIGGNISITSVLKFLRRHPRLRNVSLCGISIAYVTPKVAKRRFLLLPSLEYIRAPSLYLSEILRHIRWPSTVARISILTDFDIPTSFGKSATFRRFSVKGLFNEAKRFTSIVKMDFHFSRSELMEFCDTSHDSMPSEMFLTSVNTISLHKGTGEPLDKKALARTIDWAALFPNLSFVELWEVGVHDRSDWMSSMYKRNITPVVNELRYRSGYDD